MISSLKKLCIDYIVLNHDLYRSRLNILPEDLIKEINLKIIRKINDNYYENDSYEIYHCFDYSWFLHTGWLKNGWYVASKKDVKFKKECPCDIKVDLEENGIYYYYPSLNCEMIIIKEINNNVYINKNFPKKSISYNNPLLLVKDHSFQCWDYRHLQISSNPHVCLKKL